MGLVEVGERLGLAVSSEDLIGAIVVAFFYAAQLLVQSANLREIGLEFGRVDSFDGGQGDGRDVPSRRRLVGTGSGRCGVWQQAGPDNRRLQESGNGFEPRVSPQAFTRGESRRAYRFGYSHGCPGTNYSKYPDAPLSNGSSAWNVWNSWRSLVSPEDGLRRNLV